MAGFTALPLRLLARRAGAGFAYTEMVSAEALVRGRESIAGRMVLSAREHPVVVQLWGADPAVLAEAARLAVAAGADVVDLNLGCAAIEALNSGAGVALAARPESAEACLRAMVGAVEVPVTAKLRAGADTGDDSYLDLADRLVDAGASALALHARTAAQAFHGSADWRQIARLVERVAVPVLGNGDVRTADDALRMLAEAGCAGVLIGRAALSNPWLFADVAAALRREAAPPAPTLRDRLAVALWAGGMLSEESGGERSLPVVRRQLLFLLRAAPGIKHIRQAVAEAHSFAEISSEILAYWSRAEGSEDNETRTFGQPRVVEARQDRRD